MNTFSARKRTIIVINLEMRECFNNQMHPRLELLFHSSILQHFTDSKYFSSLALTSNVQPLDSSMRTAQNYLRTLNLLPSTENGDDRADQRTFRTNLIHISVDSCIQLFNFPKSSFQLLEFFNVSRSLLVHSGEIWGWGWGFLCVDTITWSEESQKLNSWIQLSTLTLLIRFDATNSFFFIIYS